MGAIQTVNQEMAVSAVKFAADVLIRCNHPKEGKLTATEVAQIRALGRSGRISEMRIGLMFGVTQPRISDILRWKTYKHIGAPAQIRTETKKNLVSPPGLAPGSSV